MLNFKKMQDLVADGVQDDTLSSTGTCASKSKAWLNEAYILDILTLRPFWWFLQKRGSITSVNKYNTGTVSVTTGSTTVTGSGTTFTSSMADYVIIINGLAQRISSYNSTTSLTLAEAWEGDTLTGAAFVIVKDRFDLPRWLDVKSIRYIQDRETSRQLEGVSSDELDNFSPSRSETGVARKWCLLDRVRNTYSTGTVSATAGTYVLTGASTAWTSSDIQEFDVIQVGSYVYTVKSVDSATQITVYEAIVTTIASSTTYTALMDRYRVQLYPIPDEARTYFIHGSRVVPQLTQDTDVPLLPDEWHSLIVKGARIKALRYNQDPGVESEMSEYSSLMSRLNSRNNRDDYRTESWWYAQAH